MLGHPKKFNIWFASGPIALGLFLTGLVGAMVLPEAVARWWGWLALVPLLGVLGALGFAVLAGLFGRRR